jgi:hypothetical protein
MKKKAGILGWIKTCTYSFVTADASWSRRALPGVAPSYGEGQVEEGGDIGSDSGGIPVGADLFHDFGTNPNNPNTDP